MDKVEIDRKVFEVMINKLAELPYHEVGNLMVAVQESARVIPQEMNEDVQDSAT